MRTTENKEKLSYKKFQIAKINNPKVILGGTKIDFEDECQGGDSGGMGTQTNNG